MKYLIQAAVLAVLLSSCTVKEDRSLCPCFVTIDLSDRFAASLPDGYGAIPLEISGFSGSVRETYQSLDLNTCGPAAETEVTRGEVRITGIMIPHPELYRKHSDELYLNYGEQADSVYAFSSSVDASGEEAYLSPALRKQFSTIYVECPSMASAGQVEWYVYGQCSGISLRDLSPLTGKFAYRMNVPVSPGVWAFRVPRQSKADLTMSLVTADGINYLSGIAVGRMMEKSGYDFSAEDMADVHVSIDISRFTASIRVEGWDDVYVYGLF